MRCPFCQHEDLRVIDSRDAGELNAIRRRRECLSCLRRFTTFETIELMLQVHKRDGRYEDFEQKKLIKGLDAACRHTSISYDEVIALATKISDDLMQRQPRQIETTELGDIVMEQLKKMDPIAYVRFACVYRRFTDVKDVMDVLKALQVENPRKNKEKVECH